MAITGAELMTWISSLMWPFMRISAMFIAAPLLSARSIPVRVRVLLAFLVAWVILPVLPPMPAVDLISVDALVIGAYQVLIGTAMGFIFQMVFAAFVIAGQSIANSMGLGFASIIDPQNGLQVPVVSQAFLIMVTLIFLSLNGHLMLIDMLAKSFDSLPVGFFLPSTESLWQLVNWGSTMFASGILVAMPAVAALLLCNLAFGVASRAAPQLNIFAVGFPVLLMVGLVFILLTLPVVIHHLSQMMISATDLVGLVI